MVNGQCACGFIPVIENISVYDNDKDGKGDVFYFSPVLPERFGDEENVISFSAGDYHPEKFFEVGFARVNKYYGCWQCKEKILKSYIVYEIEVAEAGIYEMAIHTRLEDGDTVERGAKYTVNEGSENAYSLEISYQFATQEELVAARDNDKTVSSYMFGIELKLEAGINTIKIEAASQSPKNQKFCDFYFVKVADLSEQ